MKDLSSYVPESLHTLQKRQKPCRLFFEDLVVIQPEKSFRILASRGENLPTGADFFNTCGVLASDAALLRSHESRQTRFLLPCEKGCVLLFGDLLSETGLLLGILLAQSTEDVFCALKRMGQDGFVTPPKMSQSKALLSSHYDETLCRHLEELFYYLERILHPTPESSLWTRCLLIANFVGCRLERVALPIETPPLSKGENACMTLFLFCAFLTLRQKSGRVQTEGKLSPKEEEPPNYRCTVTFFEETESLLELENPGESAQALAMDLPLFLQAPCFSALSAIPTEDGLKLETRFPLLPKDQTLGAVGSRTWHCLRFHLERVLTKKSV